MSRSIMPLVAALALPLIASCQPRTQAPSPEAVAWWSHVEALSTDEMAGRNTGSEGYRKAADYVAEQFAAAGAKPGGADGGYMQPVAFVARRIVEGGSSLALVGRDGRVTPLDLGEDANIGMSIEPARLLEVPIVFVGYGLQVPEAEHDDLAGLDLRGKIAMYLQGGPEAISGTLRAHAQSSEERWKALRAAGAVGQIGVSNPKDMDVPWERSTLRRLEQRMTLADPALDKTPGCLMQVSVNPARAEKFFEGSGHTFAEILAAADSNRALPHMPLAFSLRAQVDFAREDAPCGNVVGIIEGSDLVLKGEYVVLSGHLDHLGVGGAVAGDSIYNGAMDNASGIATMIEIARLAKARNITFKRSLVLLALTGEEKGLLGSRYFTHHPSVDGPIVANINMDMYLPIIPFKMMTVYGLNESDLGDWIGPVAETHGITIQDDPEPKRNIFIRSDQYNFILAGVPALSFKFGAAPGSPEEATLKAWIKERYHAPSDDLAQPVDKEGAAQLTQLLLDFCADVANRDQRPKWKDDSFFKRFERAEPVAAGAMPAGRIATR